MTSDVMYTTGWNFLLGKIARDHDWLSLDEARQMYEARKGLMVIDAVIRAPSGDPVPRWVIGLKGGAPRVTFLDDAHSIWRQVDWKHIDGRWWRWITYDNEYPNQSRMWAEYEAEYISKTVVIPDGTGRIEISEGENGPSGSDNAPLFAWRFTDRALDDYWIDIPKYGDWVALTDPGPSTYEVAGLEVRREEAIKLLKERAETE